MSKKIKIFGTGTMRSGGSLVSNILGLSSDTKVFTEIIYFARHIFKSKINFSNQNELHYIAGEISNRIYFRNGVSIPAKNFYLNFTKHRIDNISKLYESILFTFLETSKQSKKKVILEYANGEWRFIDKFLNMNKNYKSFHVIRDPRAIIASFKKITFGKKYEYLFPIFNWMDSYNYYQKYKKKFTSKRYLFLKFEDIHVKSEYNIKKILSFADLKFKKEYLSKNYWKKKLTENKDYVNFSAYNNKKQYAFNSKRNDMWQNNLENWEISLIQNLLQEPMINLGYKKIVLSDDKKLFNKGLKNIKSVPLLRKRLKDLIYQNIGTDLRINDPKIPKNWSSRYNPKKKFFHDNEYKIYINRLNILNKLKKNNF